MTVAQDTLTLSAQLRVHAAANGAVYLQLRRDDAIALAEMVEAQADMASALDMLRVAQTNYDLACRRKADILTRWETIFWSGLLASSAFGVLAELVTILGVLP